MSSALIAKNEWTDRWMNVYRTHAYRGRERASDSIPIPVSFSFLQQPPSTCHERRTTRWESIKRIFPQPIGRMSNLTVFSSSWMLSSDSVWRRVSFEKQVPPNFWTRIIEIIILWFVDHHVVEIDTNAQKPIIKTILMSHLFSKKKKRERKGK